MSEFTKREEILDKWRRLTHPKTVEDYALTVPLDDLINLAPDVFDTEVAPFLPTVMNHA